MSKPDDKNHLSSPEGEITEEQVRKLAAGLIMDGKTAESAELGDEVRGRVVELLVKNAGSADTAEASEAEEAEERGISLEQWQDLLQTAKLLYRDKKWIKKAFVFLGGVIEAKESLYFNNLTELTKLPEKLSVHGDLSIMGCTGLTRLPEKLSVDGDLWLSKDLNEQIKKDAEKMKDGGMISGEIVMDFRIDG